MFTNEGQFSFQQMTQFVQHLLLINEIDVSQTPHFNKVTDSKDKQVLVFGATVAGIYRFCPKIIGHFLNVQINIWLEMSKKSI